MRVSRVFGAGDVHWPIGVNRGEIRPDRSAQSRPLVADETAASELATCWLPSISDPMQHR
jgi:hypothetical protein